MLLCISLLCRGIQSSMSLLARETCVVYTQVSPVSFTRQSLGAGRETPARTR
ncbi:unnamed protein product [Staurois parvus]|uniref:Uncharacterized protein n=1 Tax=Staurois parvus TaxID=386267 RepID=A0ABN9BW61_9NEOB|nr:unnamed protein product [Staurois parvus]